MHPHEQHKTPQTETNKTKAKTLINFQLHQTQPQKTRHRKLLNKDRPKRQAYMPERSEGNQTQFRRYIPRNEGWAGRTSRWAEIPPNGDPLTRLVNCGIYCFSHIQFPSLPAARRGPPQAPALWQRADTTKRTITTRHNYHKELCLFNPGEKLTNAHTTKLKTKLSSRQPQPPQNRLSTENTSLFFRVEKGKFPTPMYNEANPTQTVIKQESEKTTSQSSKLYETD